MNTKLLRKAKKRVFISSSQGPVTNPNLINFWKTVDSPAERFLIYIGDISHPVL